MEFEIAVNQLAHGGIEVGGGVWVEAKSWNIGSGGGNDGADLDFSLRLLDWIAGFGHVDLAFIPKGDLVWLNSCGDEACGDRIGELAAGSCARIAPSDDFDGYCIIWVNSEGFPRFVGSGFSGESGEKRVQSGFDAVGFRIEVG